MELKFIENNKSIKWNCEICSDIDIKQEVTSITQYVQKLEKKIDDLTNIMHKYSRKIEDRNKTTSQLQALIEEHTQSHKTTSTQRFKTDTEINKPTMRSQANTGSQEQSNTKTKETKITKNSTAGEKNDVNRPQNNINMVNTSDQNYKNSDSSTNKNKIIRGSKENTSLTAVAKRKWIFISNLVKNTNEDDVVKYLNENQINVLLCNKLDIRNKDIAAFKAAVNLDDFEKMLKPEMWPNNTIIKEYKNFQKRASLLHT